jgi:hypothetical protein
LMRSFVNTVTPFHIINGAIGALIESLCC